MNRIQRAEPRDAHPICILGFVLALAGIALTASGFFMSGAPGYSTTLNLGLLNDKLILAIAGAALFLGGLVLIVSGTVLKHLGMLSGIGFGASGAPLPAVTDRPAGLATTPELATAQPAPPGRPDEPATPEPPAAPERPASPAGRFAPIDPRP